MNWEAVSHVAASVGIGIVGAGSSGLWALFACLVLLMGVLIWANHAGWDNAGQQIAIVLAGFGCMLRGKPLPQVEPSKSTKIIEAEAKMIQGQQEAAGASEPEEKPLKTVA